ncbi:MAG: GH25 family lysozyme [Erysipelotrichaceae bacterium]
MFTTSKRLVVSFLMLFLLSGCFQQKVDYRVNYDETISVSYQILIDDNYLNGFDLSKVEKNLSNNGDVDSFSLVKDNGFTGYNIKMKVVSFDRFNEQNSLKISHSTFRYRLEGFLDVKKNIYNFSDDILENSKSTLTINMPGFIDKSNAKSFGLKSVSFDLFSDTFISVSSSLVYYLFIIGGLLILILLVVFLKWRKKKLNDVKVVSLVILMLFSFSLVRAEENEDERKDLASFTVVSQGVDATIYKENGLIKYDSKEDLVGVNYLDNAYYVFLPNNRVLTGFVSVLDSYVYFSGSGRLQQGFVKIDGKKYYFDENYLMVRGPKTIDGYDYVFGDDGVLVDYFKEVDGHIVYDDPKLGCLKGYHLVQGGMRYFDDNGYMYSNWQTIDGVKKYFNNDGELVGDDVKFILDISEWNQIDWDVLGKNSSIDGFILRLGYTGSESQISKLDALFLNNLKNIKKYGFEYGIYYYGNVDSKDKALMEANFVLDVLEEYDVKPALGVYYDAEEPRIGLANYEQVIPTFLDVVKDRGYQVGVYGNVSAIDVGYLNSPLIRKYPLWLAQWYKRCDSSYEYVMWQYTSDGNIAGVDGRVDMNVLYK